MHRATEIKTENSGSTVGLIATSSQGPLNLSTERVGDYSSSTKIKKKQDKTFRKCSVLDLVSFFAGPQSVVATLCDTLIELLKSTDRPECQLTSIAFEIAKLIT